MSRRKAVLADCLRKNKTALLLFAALTVLDGAVFWGYGIITEPFVYSELLVGVFLLGLLTADYVRERRAAKARERLADSILFAAPEPAGELTLRDADYAAMLSTLQKEIARLQAEYDGKQQAADDYYTAWVHQIKTPIAVLKLQLAEDTAEHRALAAEVFRIERYVEMVLDYIRLESSSNDLVIQEYALDDFLRESLRKFGQQFVLRKLRLNYTPTDKTVVTDRKWLGFMLDQLISNALKYTPQGEITIAVHGNCIQIRDTGIGIAPEDLPRIFEKGYTGGNGRLGSKASGLGLFLTKKAADLLAAQISCDSTVGEGSCFTLTLPEHSA